MDRLEKTPVELNNEGFVKTVFPFDDDQKAVLLNIIQYSVLTLIPVVILLKLVKNYVPDADEDKGNLVILVEILAQIVVMFVALYFIHKIVAYVPTYSGKLYGDVNIINIIPALLLISITMQSKLGDKVQILVDRVMDMYDGETKPKETKKQTNVKVTQPLSQQYVTSSPGTENMAMNPPPQLQPQQTNNKSQTNEYALNEPNFNNMYAGPETHLVGAASPVMEPMAANDFMGGSFGTSF